MERSEDEGGTLAREQSVEATTGVEGEELRSLLLPDANNLPEAPPSAVEFNFVRYYAVDFLKPGHDQYVYRHANGYIQPESKSDLCLFMILRGTITSCFPFLVAMIRLCVVGLAPTHVALREEGGVTSVDFNVGKSDRSEMKVTGKRKRNAQHFETNTALCKVCANGKEFIVRCCVKGSLLEVNDRLLKQPDLLNSSADREGYVAIMMPKPTDWLKIKDSLLSHEDYKKLRGLV